MSITVNGRENGFRNDDAQAQRRPQPQGIKLSEENCRKEGRRAEATNANGARPRKGPLDK